MDELCDDSGSAVCASVHCGAPAIRPRYRKPLDASSPPSGAKAGRLIGNAPPRNRIFTGRETELAALHTILQTENAALTPEQAALHGMGGVGKTQTAREYIEWHGSKYAVVLWVLGTSPETLQSEIANLAAELDANIPVSNDQNANYRQVKQWLEAKGDFLLVVDNAENIPTLRPLLPSHKTGRVLFTTRETVPAKTVKSIEISHFDPETGATLLLRCFGHIESHQTLADADAETQAGAIEVSEELGGLALALDQAGAYLHERGIAPDTYLTLYRVEKQKLHRDYNNPDHERVEVTFRMALKQVKRIPKVGYAAVELVKWCAFLAPDSIPDEVFTEGKVKFGSWWRRWIWGTPNYLDVAAAACRYGLMKRESNPSGLWMHRLAQEVVRDSMGKMAQQIMRVQVVLAVNAASPYPEYETWELYERLLPHVLLCEGYIKDDQLHIEGAARLLNQTAYYLLSRARYEEAERCVRQALAIYRQVYGEKHPNIAAVLNNLGRLLTLQGKYAEAEEVLREAVEMDARTLGIDHPHYADHLDNLASVYYYQQRLEEALPLREQALDLTRRHFGAEHSNVGIRLANLGTMYSDMGRFGDAVAAYEEVQSIQRSTIGEQHPDYATSLFNLARIYIQGDKFDPAELLLHQATSLHEVLFGTQHPDTANCYSWLGQLRYRQGRLADAAGHFETVLGIRERVLGLDHPHTEYAREWLALVRAEM